MLLLWVVYGTFYILDFEENEKYATGKEDKKYFKMFHSSLELWCPSCLA